MDFAVVLFRIHTPMSCQDKKDDSEEFVDVICSLVNIQTSFFGGFIVYSSFTVILAKPKWLSETGTPSAKEVWFAIVSEIEYLCLPSKTLAFFKKAVCKSI